MSWAEIKKAVNSDLGTPLNELLTYYDNTHATPSDNVQAILIDSEVASTTSTTSVIIASWTSQFVGKVKFQWTIFANSVGNGFWCSTSSSPTTMESAQISSGTLAVRAPYWPSTTETIEVNVSVGKTYYFHLAGNGTSGDINRGKATSIKVLFDAGGYFFAPMLRKSNFVFNPVTLVLGTGTSEVTYTGNGEISLIGASGVSYIMAIDGGTNVNVSPGTSVLTVPFNKSVKVKGSTAACVWYVTTS